MHTKSSLDSVMYSVDLLVAEIAHLRTEGPQFRIVHRFRMPGSNCLPGEEVAAVFVCYRGREHQLRLSLAQRMVFDFLANHSRLAQSARQIELGIRADDFYTLHATNASGDAPETRLIPRSSVKEHIRRIVRALTLAFQEAGIGLDPQRVLIAEETVGNEVGYRLKATCRWSHIDLTSERCAPLLG